MLNIRLQRTGKRGQAHFRIIIAEHTKKPKGKVLELLGHFNPHEEKVEANKERIEYWISKGAQITPTVNNLLVNYKIWDRPKMQSWKPKVKPKTVQGPTTKDQDQKEKSVTEEQKTEEGKEVATQEKPDTEEAIPEVPLSPAETK